MIPGLGRFALAICVAGALAGRQRAARADDCLGHPTNAPIVLSFVTGADAIAINEAIKSSGRPWDIHPCDDRELLRRIKDGDQIELTQLLGRKVVLAIEKDGSSFVHHLIAYTQMHVLKGLLVPPTPSFLVCNAEHSEVARRRYDEAAAPLLSAAVGLYELSRTECPQLADANVKLQEAIAALAKANAKNPEPADKELQDFLRGQAAELTSLAIARSCAPPRALNLRLIDDRRKRASPSALTQIVLGGS